MVFVIILERLDLQWCFCLEIAEYWPIDRDVWEITVFFVSGGWSQKSKPPCRRKFMSSKLLAGPIVRRATKNRVCVWLATRQPITIKLEILDQNQQVLASSHAEGGRPVIARSEKTCMSIYCKRGHLRKDFRKIAYCNTAWWNSIHRMTSSFGICVL